MILSGNMRDRIDLYRELEVKNAYSDRVKSHTFAFSERTEYSWVSGTESTTGQVQAISRTLKFKVRYVAGRFNERMIVKFQGDYYAIRAIDPDRYRTYMILTAERVPASTLKLV